MSPQTTYDSQCSDTFFYLQIAEEVERQSGPEPSAPTSQVSSGPPPTLPQPPTSTQPTVVPRPASSASCPVVQESLAAVLDKMQNAARALVRIIFTAASY